MKTCCICKCELPEKEFSKTDNWHGYACRVCVRDYNRVAKMCSRAKKAKR